MEIDACEKRSTWRQYHGNIAVWNDDRDCEMRKYEYDYENVDKKSDTCAEQDCIISNSCGLCTGTVKDCIISNSFGPLLKSLLRRDRCHNEREATIDHASEARLGDDNSSRDEAKWQEDHGSVAALFINSHGTTSAETSRSGIGVTIAECEALYTRSGDNWLGGKFWQNAWLGRKT